MLSAVLLKDFSIYSAISRLFFLCHGAGTSPGNLLTTHFLSALNEISTSIPRMDAVALAPTKNSQYTLRRRQTDMIESLSFNAALLDDPGLARRVSLVKSQIYGIHRQTADSEEAFKDAVGSIEKTTAFLLKELPLLHISLVRQRNLDSTVQQLGAIISRIGSLILELEQVGSGDLMCESGLMCKSMNLRMQFLLE